MMVMVTRSQPRQRLPLTMMTPHPLHLQLSLGCMLERFQTLLRQLPQLPIRFRMPSKQGVEEPVLNHPTVAEAQRSHCCTALRGGATSKALEETDLSNHSRAAERCDLLLRGSQKHFHIAGDKEEQQRRSLTLLDQHVSSGEDLNAQFIEKLFNEGLRKALENTGPSNALVADAGMVPS